MIMIHKRILSIVLSAALICGCAPVEPKIQETIAIPDINTAEMSTLWENQLKHKLRIYAIEDGILYAVTYGNEIYKIDYASGKILSEQKFGEARTPCDGLSVSHGVLALNYTDQIKVYDTNLGSIVYEYNPDHMTGIVEFDYELILKDNLLICANSGDGIIYAVDYKTGATVWTIGEVNGDRIKHSILKYKDKSFYENNTIYSFFEFDPMTGATLAEYPYTEGAMVTNGTIGNTMSVFTGIEDKDFLKWLKDRTSGAFYTTENGSYYGQNENILFFHNPKGELVWEMPMPSKILSSMDWHKYLIIGLDGMALVVDTADQSIVWSYKGAISPLDIEIEKDVLFVPMEDGKLVAYDLTSLSSVAK